MMYHNSLHMQHTVYHHTFHYLHYNQCMNKDWLMLYQHNYIYYYILYNYMPSFKLLFYYAEQPAVISLLIVVTSSLTFQFPPVLIANSLHGYTIVPPLL